MKTRKGTFIQRKNRTEGVSKSKTQTKAKKTQNYSFCFGKDYKGFDVEHIRKTNPELFNQPKTFPFVMDEPFPTPEGFIDMPIENDSGEVIDMFGRWNNGGWYKTPEMIHYCMYGAFGEGDYMEFQNLYNPDNPFKEIDELIDNS